jgi:hypothetical protein
MADGAGLKEKFARLRKNIKTKKIRLNVHSVEMSVLEALFSRGDRRLSLLLESAFKKGARFDSWKDIFKYHIWQEAMEEAGTDTNKYLKGRTYSEPLAWDHITSGISKESLIKESILAHKEAGITACTH